MPPLTPAGVNAAHLLTRRAHLTPARTALVEWATGRRFTYRDLAGRARGAAAFLHARGARKGDRVAVLAPNGLHYVDLFFAAGLTGTLLMPLSHRLALPELEELVRDGEPTALVYGGEYGHLAERLPVPAAIRLDEYEARIAAAARREIPAVEVAPCDIHSLLYTSGTTGKPKGAMLSHGMIVWNAVNTVMSWGLRENDAAPVFTPQFHSGGLNVLMAPLFHIGGRIVLTKSFEPREALAVIEKEKATIVFMVPSMFQMTADEPGFDDTDFSAVRFFLSGGAPCPLDLMARYRTKGAPFRQGFGMTEAGVNCFTMTDEESSSHAGTVGKPVFHGEARVVRDDGSDAPTGEMGELVLRGPHIFSGYWRKPRETEEAFRGGWLLTGDLASADGDGFFTIVGRKKEMIISGGENVYLAEVEQVLAAHPSVREVAVVGVPDRRWGEVGRAVVVLHPGEECAADALTAFCAERLARYKVPKSFVFAGALPRNAYGKLLREELREAHGAP